MFCLDYPDHLDYLYHYSFLVKFDNVTNHDYLDLSDNLYLILLFEDRVPAKRFFHPLGFHAWDKLNNQYQGVD